MQRRLGKNNAHSLFGVHQIPSANQIRNLLDPLPPETRFPGFAELREGLYRTGYLHPFRSLCNTFLVAFDGPEYCSSPKLGCDPCSHRTLSTGATPPYHVALTPGIVAPGQEAGVPGAPEFGRPPAGHDHQDCELAAARRGLEGGGAYKCRFLAVVKNILAKQEDSVN